MLKVLHDAYRDYADFRMSSDGEVQGAGPLLQPRLKLHVHLPLLTYLSYCNIHSLLAIRTAVYTLCSPLAQHKFKQQILIAHMAQICFAMLPAEGGVQGRHCMEQEWGCSSRRTRAPASSWCWLP